MYFYPFPCSWAIYHYSGWLIVLMTAGSNSRMTLFAVTNKFQNITNNIPELIALYYTSRMPRNLESPHQKCHVLVSWSLRNSCIFCFHHLNFFLCSFQILLKHCHDNWIVTSNSNKYEQFAGTDAFDGDDVMLVEFIRAVLNKITGERVNPLTLIFKCYAPAEDIDYGTMHQKIHGGLIWTSLVWVHCLFYFVAWFSYRSNSRQPDKMMMPPKSILTLWAEDSVAENFWFCPELWCQVTWENFTWSQKCLWYFINGRD